jgi:thiol-disulfide isomerase/thioredoxin
MRLLMVAALFPVSAAAQGIAPGTRAPEIDLPTLDGGRIKLSALRGHPVVVTFWGTWCQGCRDEFPDLVAAQKSYGESGLRVLAVNQRDQELSTKDVSSLIKEYSVPFIVALDERGKSRRSCRLLAIPTTVFIDSAGVIQRVHSGGISRAELARGLDAILRHK